MKEWALAIKQLFQSIWNTHTKINFDRIDVHTEWNNLAPGFMLAWSIMVYLATYQGHTFPPYFSNSHILCHNFQQDWVEFWISPKNKKYKGSHIGTEH